MVVTMSTVHCDKCYVKRITGCYGSKTGRFLTCLKVPQRRLSLKHRARACNQRGQLRRPEHGKGIQEHPRKNKDIINK